LTLPADRTNLGRWVSAKDNSRDKTSTVQKVDRRHRSLPRKLEFQKFKPSVAAASGCTLSEKLLDLADGGV
jgi:hypothetical protein